MRMEDGSELALGMRPGRQEAYNQDRFATEPAVWKRILGTQDIVTALPEPSGASSEPFHTCF